MTIELPTPDSREAELWAEILTPIIHQQYPLLGLRSREHSKTILQLFLEALNEYYDKKTSR